MIVDCDSHFMPLDAFQHVPKKFCDLVPQLRFDSEGTLTGIDFPRAPPPVPGTTPLRAPTRTALAIAIWRRGWRSIGRWGLTRS